MKAKPMLEEIAWYAIDFCEENLTDKIVTAAKRSIIDSMACMIAGKEEMVCQIARQYVLENSGKEEATIVGGNGQKRDVYHVAMVNGVAAHALDYDDGNESCLGHPSAVVWPTVLALGEALQKTGKEVLLAYVTGVEIYALFGKAVVPEHNQQGWNTTESLGVFAATAAAGKLLGLQIEQMMYALGFAASEVGGLKGNSGTMTKPFQIGRASCRERV